MLKLHWQNYRVERLRWFLVVFDGKGPNERWNDHLISATSQRFLRIGPGKIYCFKILACFVYRVWLSFFPQHRPTPSTLFSSTSTPHFCYLFSQYCHSRIESSHSLCLVFPVINLCNTQFNVTTSTPTAFWEKGDQGWHTATPIHQYTKNTHTMN